MIVAEKPLVSVIITCFNQQQFVTEAIESVLQQTYSNWECFLIDDGSSDGTAAICKTYAANDERFQYFFQENTGVSAARNRGFVLSKGKYIQFLDGDDFLRAEKLQLQVDFMEMHNHYDVTYTNHEHYWQSSGNYARYSFDEVGENPLEQFLTGYDRGVSIPLHAALLRRDIWLENETPFPADYRYRYEDWIFWVLIALKNKRFKFMDQHLVVYRMHNSNFVAKAEDVAFHSLQSAIYISQYLRGDRLQKFQQERFRFILKCYGNRYLQQQNSKILLLQLFHPVSQFYNKLIFRFKQLINR